MAVNKLRGDSPAVAQVWKLTPVNVETGDVFKITINRKTISVTATSEVLGDLATLIVAAFNDSTVPEFTEITATKSGNNILLTSDTLGVDFEVSVSTVNSSTSASIEIVETTAGVEAGNEVQKIELAGAYTGGTFTLTNDFGSGDETTSAIAYNATAATVQTALEALASVSSGDVAVTGDAGGPWYVELKGTYAATEVAEFTVDGSSLTGTNAVNITTVVNGYGGADTVYLLSTLGGLMGANSGTFTITHSGNTTSALAHDATPAAIQTALEGLASIGAGNVEVSGYVSGNTAKTGATYVIRFVEDFAGTNVTITVSSINLAISADLEKITSGGAASWDEVQVFDLGGIDDNNLDGTDTWVYSHTGTGTTSAASYGRIETLLGVGATYYDNVESNGEADAFASYVSYDLDRLEGLYGAVGIIGRHFLSGSGFVAVFSGAAVDETDQDEGQIGTAGVSRTLNHAAAVATVIDGGSGSDNEEQSIRVEGSGGTFTITYDGQTTSAIAAGALASAVDTALEALSNIGSGDVTVTGTGTFADPYIVEFTGTLGSQNLPEMTGDGTSLTGGSGQVSEVTPHVVAVDEVQTITIDPSVTGGTFTLTYDGETTVAIAYNAAAATVETELEALASIPGVTVAGSAGGPWTVTFDTGAIAGLDVDLLTADETNLTGGAGTQSITVVETVRSSGPNHWDDPLNWTLDRIPGSGDTVVIEKTSISMLRGLKQRAEFTADASTEYLTIENHDFRNEQALRVKSTTTLPAGLSVATDYFVIEVDKDTIQLEASVGGGAINITDAGTGTHTIGVEFASVDFYSYYSGAIGLPRYNSEGAYYEYRNRFLAFWVVDSGPLKIGEGLGQGSPRMNLDYGDSLAVIEILLTGGSQESGVPALLLKGENTSTTCEMLTGDVGIAFERGETSSFLLITQRGGNLVIGKGHTNGNIKKTGGTCLVLGGSINGTLSGNF